jgi:outer membrane receptor protein involved in Fe transport
MRVVRNERSTPQVTSEVLVVNVKLATHKNSPRTLLLAAATVAGVVPINVLAQDADEPGAVIQEIVVTAQKREQRLQDVPMAVSAVSGAQLEQQGITQFQDLLRNIPGVSASGVEPGQSRYAIRGISTQASSPTVGIYMDDISLVTVTTSFSGAFDPAFFDFERVEVLKGPQGTLYGGSAMGGAIKYVSRQPVLNETSFNTAAGIATTRGGDLSYEAEGVVNIPVIDNRVALRAGVLYRKTGGYVDNVADQDTEVWTRSATLPPAPFEPVRYSSRSTYNAEDYNERDLLALRLSGKIEASDTLSIVPAVFYQRSDKDNDDLFFTNLPGFQSSVRFGGPSLEKNGIYSLTINKQFDAVDLVSISGYFDRQTGLDRDYSLYGASLMPALLNFDSYNSSDTDSETFTQEVRLSSTPGNGPWQWVVGLFYADQDDRLVQVARTPGAGAAFGVGTDVLYFGDQRTESEQYAAFGEVTYSILPQLDLTLGLRYFEARQTVNGDFDGLFNGGPSQVDDKKSKDSGVTPKVSLAWRATDDSLIYGTASKGFRQGGPNRFNTSSPLCAPDLERLGLDRAPGTYDPDTLWTYEIGSKNQLLDRTLTVNGAVYYTDWSKIQQQVDLSSCGFQFVGNVGKARVQGAELALESAVTNALTLGGTVTYTDSEITESAPGVSAQVGQSVLDTPEWMGNVYGDYTFEFGASTRASLRAEYQYRGSNLRAFETTTFVSYPDGSIGSLPNTTRLQDSYDVVNLNFTVFRNNWQYRLYVNNLLDDAPYIDFSRGSGYSVATTLRPRTIGAGVRMTF